MQANNTVMTKGEKDFITRFTGRYKSQYVLYFLLVVLMSVFSICSILSLNNFLQILFTPSGAAASSSSELDNLLNTVYGWFLGFGKTKALIYFTLIILGIYFLKDVFTWLSQYQIGRTRNYIIRDIRSAIFKKFSLQDIVFISKYKKGD